MSGIKYYTLKSGESLPVEFAVVENVHGEPEIRAFYERSDELRVENAKLREELADAPKCETCEAMLDCDECLRADRTHKERRRLSAENAKLRELAVLQSVIFKHMSTCPTTDCQVCPVKEECAESVHLEGLLGIDDKETSWLVQWRSEDAADVRAENAKLRELVGGLEYCVQGHLCDCCPLYDPSGTNHRRCESLERELGIEVDE